MKETPLVSIICTAYNHEAYIKDALEGFIMQKTSFPFEIIVHDDASTDRTAEIIRLYEARHPELFANIYQTENQYSKGKGDVGRIVFGAARGKYIALCEGDDYWTDPLKLQKQVDFLEVNREHGIVFTDADILINRSNQVIPAYDKTYNKKIPQGDVLTQLIYLNNYKSCTSLFLSIAIHNYFEFFGGKTFMMGDWGIWLYIAQKYKVGYINESTSVYRIQEESASHFKDFSKFYNFLMSGNQLRLYFAKKLNIKLSALKIIFWNTRLVISYLIKKLK